MKISKICKVIIAFFMLLLNCILISSNVNAVNIGESKTLERGKLGYYCVQKWDGNKWIYLTYNQTFYTDNDGQKYIAYCLSPGSPGVGYVNGESESYDVKINKMLDDDRIWRVLKNGYPNKSKNQLGVETADDAYFATMQAVNAILRGYTLDQARELYSVGKFEINGENFDDIQRRGEKTLNAMFNLIDIGLNGKETRNQFLEISLQKETDLIKENENYYSQTFKIKSLAEVSEYSISKLEGMPKGTFIADVNGKDKQSFRGEEKFKIMIPAKEIKNDVKGNIEVTANQKNYPVYFGESSLQGFQNYALCNNSYSNVNVKTDVNIKSNNSELNIIKVDAETKKPIEGVKFRITTDDGSTNIYKTDKNGCIIIKNQTPGNIKVKEIESVGNYKIDSNERNIVLNYNETKTEIFENRLQKGNIRIVKVDKDNNEVKLKGVIFEILNQNGEIVKQGSTNENGELLFENLEIGEYRIKEVETNKEYELFDEEIVINVSDNEINSVVIENQKKNKQIIKTIVHPKKVEKVVEQVTEKTVEKQVINNTVNEIQIKKELPKTGKDNKINSNILNAFMFGYSLFFVMRRMVKKVDK